MSIQELDSGTIRLISSTVNIYSVFSVVKELVENSLDAGADNVVVRLEKNGSSRIEVRDNGSGITRSNALLVGRANHTSKIVDYLDLDRLGSYGFRGQAINSLCAVADVSFTTRSKEDEFGLMYTLNEEGKSVSSKPTAHLVGTTVVIQNLFARIPVRRKMLSTASSLRSVLRLLRCFGLAKPSLSISLSHDGSSIWRKSSSSSLSSAAQEVMGYKLAVQMQYIYWKGSQSPVERVEEEESVDVSEGDEPVCLEMEVEMLVPKKGINIMEVSSFPSPEGYIPNVYLLINGRPVKYKKIEQLVNLWINRGTLGELPKRKKPAWILKLELPPDKIDVNLEADKTKVLLRAEEVLISRLEEVLSEYYLMFNNVQNVPAGPPANSVLSSQKPKEAGEQPEDKALSESQEEPQVLPSKEDVPNESRKVPNSRKIMRDLSPSKELPTKQRKVCEEVVEINNAERNYCDDNPPSTAPSLSQILNVNGFVERLNSNNQPYNDEDIIEIRIPVLPVNDDEVDARKDPEEVDGNFNLKESDATMDMYSDQEWDAQLLRVEEVSGANEGESSGNAQLQRINEIESVEVGKANEDVAGDNEEVICVQDAENNALSQLPKVDDWSRGNVGFGGTKALDPVKILLPGKTIYDDDGEKLKLKRVPTVVNKHSKESSSSARDKNHVLNANDILMANSPLPHACSQMGRRDMRGFQEFSANGRLKILEKNPGMKSSEVAELLAVKWKALSRTEKEIYEKRAQYAISSRQQDAKEDSSNSFTPNKNQNLKQQVLTESFTTTPPAPKPRRLSKEPLPLPSIGMVMEVSVEQVENAVMQSESKNVLGRKTKDSKVHLIGQLKPSRMWVCRKKNKIGILRHFALQEVVVFAKLMESLSIPMSPLQKPIEINERNLGPVLWENLLSLERQRDVFTDSEWVTSKILSKNGFRIKITLDENEETCGSVTDVAPMLPSCGISELKEILSKNCLQSSKLSDTRPIMVVDYIKSEAVRMCRQSPPVMNKGDMIDLLKNWSEDSQSLCLHAQSIFHVIKTLESDE